METIVWGKEGDMNAEEWGNALRKYSSLVLDGRMAEMNLNDISYFKGQTIIDPNGNKLTLHDAVVENVDGVIYAVQNEGVNVETNTNFDKNFGNLGVMENTYIPWDNSKTKK
jgi:hypothetical protein